MPQLRRNARPLLSTVRGKPHASSDDHEEGDSTHAIRTSATKRRKSTRTEAESTMVTPPATNSTVSSQTQANVIDLQQEDEDWVNADPIDSDDEVVASKPVRARFGGFRSANVDLSDGCGKKVEEVFRFAGQEEVGKKGSGGKKSGSPASGEKRGFRDVTTEREPDWWNAGTPKKQKKDNVKPNIHVPPRTSQGYGKNSQRTRERKLKKASQQTKASPEKDAKGPAFQLLDIGHGPDDSVSTDQPFAIPGAEDEDLEYARLDSSSSLSSARSTPDPDELQLLDLPDATPYKPLVDCSYCGQPIDKFVVEEFEDKYHTGGDLSFKWKRRFCKFHKEQDAHDIWRERSYPTIEWTGLERRMRKHNAFLIDILNDRKPSHYRQTLKDNVKPGTKGIRQAYNAAVDTKDGGSRPGASVGYYGPKGEKIMTDHIISSLSDDIRKQAKKDKLVASSGVQGGVSGFVQAVLVPHLAEQLIKEDMKLTGDWSSQARDIITDSCEVGEILYPEVEDGVVEIPDDNDHGGYG